MENRKSSFSDLNESGGLLLESRFVKSFEAFLHLDFLVGFEDDTLNLA